jgi:hypothetical protein
MSKRTLFILIFIICLIVVCAFCLTITMGSYSVANADWLEPLPTLAPMETCSNGGLTILDGCRWIYLPVIGR